MKNIIGAQLYTVRDYCQTKEDFDETIKKVSEIGYKAVQLSGNGDIAASDIREICDKYGVTIPCTHRSMEEFRNDFDYSVEFHKTCGCTLVGIGGLPGWDSIKTKQQVMNLVKEFNEISDKFKKEGLDFAFHNHALEFKKIDGKFIMDYFIEFGKFDFIVDVYWLAVAGINPGRFIRENKGRIKMIHFKDLKVVNNAPAICEVMEGNLDWDDIIAAAHESDAEYAFVEQDTCDNGAPFTCLETSYNNLKTKGFN